MIYSDPNGSPGAGDRLHMVWTEGVCTGKLTRQKFVDVIATQPAKINGIYPRKGTLAVGSDADVVIFDPNYEGTVHLADNPNGVDYNLYEAVVSLVGWRRFCCEARLWWRTPSLWAATARENSSLQICTHPVTKTEINQV
mgnify:FL=1